MCVFGMHDPSTCTLYVHPLILANPNEIHASAAPTASQVDKKMSCCRMFLLTKLPKDLTISMLNNVTHLSFFLNPFPIKVNLIGFKFLKVWWTFLFLKNKKVVR